MDFRRKEIRHILSGFSSFDGEKITAEYNIFKTDIQGTLSGAFTSKFLGLATVKRQYKLKDNPDELKEKFEELFSKIGFKVELKTAPDAIAAMFIPHLHNPYIVTADFDGKQVLLQYYTAKTPAAYLFGKITLDKTEQKNPELFSEKNQIITITPQLIKPDVEEIDLSTINLPFVKKKSSEKSKKTEVSEKGQTSKKRQVSKKEETSNKPPKKRERR